MSSCHCCLPSHPSRLLERLNLSIQTIKLIRKNCSIFETLLIDEYEQLERLVSNLNRYLMHYGNVSEQIFAHLSRCIIRINTRSKTIAQLLHELECVTNKCSIWLKNNSAKALRSQLKRDGKQLDLFMHFSEQTASSRANLSRKFSTDFSTFRANYQQSCLQMDCIERDHISLFMHSVQLFSSIVWTASADNVLPPVNIDQNVNEWKKKNKFRIPWLLDEHQPQKENLRSTESAERSSSDIEIKAIDDGTGDGEAKVAYESNLSWSFTVAEEKEDSSTRSFVHQSSGKLEPYEPTANAIKSAPLNRVRLAIEAIERKTSHFPRERKS